MRMGKMLLYGIRTVMAMINILFSMEHSQECQTINSSWMLYMRIISLRAIMRAKIL